MSRVRPSAIAGTWYPGNPDRLRSMIEELFSKVEKKPPVGDLLGIISPHAGYVYSGQTAAYSYHSVRGQSYDVVVLVSPMHRMIGQRYVVHDADYYETPLGKIPVDHDIVDGLSKHMEIGKTDWDNEHSLEIQLPFLQVAMGSFKLVPVMVGHDDVFDVEDCVSAMEEVLADRNVLWIASTDLHHIPDYDEVVRKDADVVQALETINLSQIRTTLNRPDCSVCGRVPVSIVTDVTQRRGANRLAILHQTNSGDVTGDRSPGQYTVGYLAAAILIS